MAAARSMNCSLIASQSEYEQIKQFHKQKAARMHRKTAKKSKCAQGTWTGGCWQSIATKAQQK